MASVGGQLGLCKPAEYYFEIQSVIFSRLFSWPFFVALNKYQHREIYTSQSASTPARDLWCILPFKALQKRQLHPQNDWLVSQEKESRLIVLGLTHSNNHDCWNRTAGLGSFPRVELAVANKLFLVVVWKMRREGKDTATHTAGCCHRQYSARNMANLWSPHQRQRLTSHGSASAAYTQGRESKLGRGGTKQGNLRQPSFTVKALAHTEVRAWRPW